jgi:PAS domain S-box-containing protein
VVPIKQQGHDRPAGFLVVGINPYRRYDAAYAGFVDLVAGQLAAGIASARAYDEERRRAQALAELDHAKTQFFSNVSHEFRTPLTLMLGPLEDMLAKPSERFDPENRELVTVVHRNGLRLLRLVNSLLDFSRIEAGRVKAVYAPTDLAALTAELASSFRSATERAGLWFVVDCASLPEPAYLDREMWEKIVFNLLSNALKFTLQGGITVELRRAGDRAELRVIDTGTGIPEKELPHLFERFHRVEGARGRTFEGSGIGLALVQELVQLHGGSIWVESVLDHGSTFVVSLPLGKAHLRAEQIGRPSAAAVSTAVPAEAFVVEALRWLPDEGSPSRGQSPPSAVTVPEPVETVGDMPGQKAGTVLIADDNADMREYVRRLLRDQYRVIGAANGTEALRLAIAQNPDLVLSDVMMPGLDGFSLLQALRSDARTRTTPVILLSARAGEEARSKGMDAGADDYIAKPFSARELLARVGAHLKLARMRKDAEAALRESEARFAAAFAQAPVGMILTTPEGLISEANQAFQSMLGYRSDELLMRHALDFAHPDDVARIRSFFETRQSESNDTAVIETRLIRSDGQCVWARGSVTVRRDDQGSTIQIIGIVENITERKLMQEALRVSQERLQQVFAQAPVGVAVLRGRDLVIELANAEYEKFFPGRKLLGRPFREAVPEVSEKLLDVIQGVFTNGEAFIGNEYLIPLDREGDGTVEDCWFTFVYQPLKEANGQVSGIVVVAVDVTAHVRARQGLERANRELEEFAYVSSHDMQEPLRMVNIYAHLLLKSLAIETPEAQEYAAFIRQGVLRMEHLIRDLLSYSRVIHSDGVAAGTADLAESLSQALETIRPRIDETQAMITADPLPKVRGETAQLAHVFQNLFSNSLKYRKTGTCPEIHISVEGSGSQWIVAVRDNGIGFEQRYAERIFGLFKRLHKEEYAGTGLGLAICQRIVDRFGGRMWAEGRPGDGATFYFTLTGVEAHYSG